MEPGSLHWKVDSKPLAHEESPSHIYFFLSVLVQVPLYWFPAFQSLSFLFFFFQSLSYWFILCTITRLIFPVNIYIYTHTYTHWHTQYIHCPTSPCLILSSSFHFRSSQTHSSTNSLLLGRCSCHSFPLHITPFHHSIGHFFRDLGSMAQGTPSSKSYNSSLFSQSSVLKAFGIYTTFLALGTWLLRWFVNLTYILFLLRKTVSPWGVDIKFTYLLIFKVCVCVCLCAKLLQLCLFATPWTVACHAPLSMEFSRQK